MPEQAKDRASTNGLYFNDARRRRRQRSPRQVPQHRNSVRGGEFQHRGGRRGRGPDPGGARGGQPAEWKLQQHRGGGRRGGALLFQKQGGEEKHREETGAL